MINRLYPYQENAVNEIEEKFNDYLRKTPITGFKINEVRENGERRIRELDSSKEYQIRQIRENSDREISNLREENRRTMDRIIRSGSSYIDSAIESFYNLSSINKTYYWNRKTTTEKIEYLKSEFKSVERKASDLEAKILENRHLPPRYRRY